MEESAFGFNPPDIIEISIELNTAITNATHATTDAVMGLTYTDVDGDAITDGAGHLGAAGDYTGGDNEVLSDDGTAIMWEISSSDLGINDRTEANNGGTVTIGGIMADASAVGNGEDITATVIVSGLEASGSPVKLADVTTGLDIEVTAATGLQCEARQGSSHHHVHGRF